MTMETMGRQAIGIDAPRERRPGEPMEQEPHPVGYAHWTTPDRQEPTVRVLTGAGIALTPVFGTAQPPKGISGAIRRVAYAIPDYRVRHWGLLLLADRVDWVESAVGRAVRRPSTWIAAALAVVAIRAVRARA